MRLQEARPGVTLVRASDLESIAINVARFGQILCPAPILAFLRMDFDAVAHYLTVGVALNLDMASLQRMSAKTWRRRGLNEQTGPVRDVRQYATANLV